MGRIALELAIELSELSGEAEHRLISGLEEALADPVLQPLGFADGASRQLVAEHPMAANAIVRLHHAYLGAQASAEDYAGRLRSDPLFSQLLHQILSGITAARSSAEILEEVPGLADDERRRFVDTIARETRGLTDVARTLIGHFDREAGSRRAATPVRELDDLIFAHDNYFPRLEAIAADLRAEVEGRRQFDETALAEVLDRAVRCLGGP